MMSSDVNVDEIAFVDSVLLAPLAFFFSPFTAAPFAAAVFSKL